MLEEEYLLHYAYQIVSLTADIVNKVCYIDSTYDNLSIMQVSFPFWFLFTYTMNAYLGVDIEFIHQDSTPHSPLPENLWRKQGAPKTLY